MGNELFVDTVRVFFEKKGRIKYISHLDIVRCISRAIKRSGLPVWYTLGFNPHIYLTFALPLSLGFESECESMDFRLTEHKDPQEIIESLNRVFPEGLRVYKAVLAVTKPEAIRWAQYDIRLEYDCLSGEEVAKEFEAFCGQSCIETSKRTKKGEKTIDLKPLFSIQKLIGERNAVTMVMRAAAGTSLNINPTLVLNAFAAQSGRVPDWMKIVRTRILTEKLEDFV